MCLSIFYPILSMRSIHWFLQVQFFPIEATRIICFASKNTHPPTVASSSHEILRSLWKPRSLHGANQHSTIGNYSLIEVNQEKINFIDWEANGLRSWAEFPLLFVQHMFSAKIMGLPTQCMHQFISYAVSDRALPVHRHPSKSSCSGSPKKGGWRGWNKLDQSITCVSIFQTY